jgi:DNA-binding GntR family transcriptional regulator
MGKQHKVELSKIPLFSRCLHEKYSFFEKAAVRGCAGSSCGIMYTTMTRAYRQSRAAAAGEAPTAQAAAAAKPVDARRDERGHPRGDEAPRAPRLTPIASRESFKGRAYTALKDAIVGMDVYRSRSDIKLDERRLASDLGVSRTPVREAMAQLEREGFVRAVPRRGIYVMRKSKREVIEMITAWAALESMSARLITQGAQEHEIASLRTMFATFENGQLHARLDEYSEVNIEFHQAIIRLSRNAVLISLAENLFAHMRMIRRKTIGEQDRAARSIRDHMSIIEALEARDTNRAEDLVRDHALGLAEHVAKYADYLD